MAWLTLVALRQVLLRPHSILFSLQRRWKMRLYFPLASSVTMAVRGSEMW
jgi:hypothetical protein